MIQHNNLQNSRCLPAPEKGQIDDGRERIDKLQDEGFEDETLFKTLVCLWHL